MRIIEIKTEHGHTFKSLIDVMKDIVTEVNMEFIMDKVIIESKEGGEPTEKDLSGIKILAVGSSGTALINMKLEKKNFSTFKCAEKKRVIGVNLCQLSKVLKSVEKNDILTLFIDSQEPDNLGIILDNKSKNMRDILKFKLLDLNVSKIDIPPIKFDATVQINSSDFQNVCKRMKTLSDQVEITCSANRIDFECKGDVADRRTSFSTDDVNGECVNIKMEDGKNNLIINGIYDLNHLVQFSKCAVLCNTIELYMKNDYPLVINYRLPKLGRILLCSTQMNTGNTNTTYEEHDQYYSDDNDN